MTVFCDVDRVSRETRMSLRRANVKIVDTAEQKSGAADRAIIKVGAGSSSLTSIAYQVFSTLLLLLP